jgi:succinate dehydrogenase / fumarate reductase cytochrome b subunit
MHYRWQYSNTLSILHRISGLGLAAAGLVLLIYWLVAAASGEEAYARAQEVFASPVVTVLLFLVSLAFFYHMLNGIRHLVWDTGRGLERQTARKSGWAVFISAILLTLILWLVIGGAA